MAWVLLLIVLLLLLTYQVVLRTQFGGRWALGFVTNQWFPELRYQGMTGNLSQGITLEHVQYEDEALSFSATEIETGTLSLGYWQPAVVLAQLKVNGGSLAIKESATTENKAPMAWQGFALPVAVDVNDISVTDFTWQQDTPIHLASLTTELKVRGDDWRINRLNLKTKDLSLRAQVKLQTNAALNLNVSSDWHWQTSNMTWLAKLDIKGDKNQLTGALNQTYQDEVIDGHINSEIKLHNIMAQLGFEVTTSSNSLKVSWGQNDPISVQLPALKLAGSMDAYELSGQATFHTEQFNQIATSWQANGDLNGLNIDQFNLSGDAGEVMLEGALAWIDGLAWDGELHSLGFNPAWVHKDWSGHLDSDAEVNFNWNDAENWNIDVPRSQIKGQLKNNPLTLLLSGHSGVSSGQTVKSEATVQGSWGNNTVHLLGKHEGMDADWELVSDLSLKQLALIDPELSGEVSGTVSLQGLSQAAQVEALLKGSGLNYGKHHVSRLTFDVEGELDTTSNHEWSIHTAIQDASIAGEKINALTIDLNGPLNAHDVVLNIEANDARTEAKIKGQFNQKNQSYAGSIVHHELFLNGYEGRLSLVDAVDFQVSPSAWHLNKSCWEQQGANASDLLCLDVKSTKNSQIAGELSLSRLDLSQWSFMLPEGLTGQGVLNGGLNFNLVGDDVDVNAQLDLVAGILQVDSMGGQAKTFNFTRAAMSAQQQNEQSEVQLELVLDDGSYLNAQTVLKINQSDPASHQKKLMQQVYLDGEFESYLADNDMLSGFFDEIKQIEGQLKASGKINGPLDQPQVFAQLSLEDGDIDLQSMDVPLSQVKAEIKSVSESDFQYVLSAQAGQGQLKVTGDVLFPENSTWQLTSHVEGQDFLVAEGGQINLAISPKLDVKHASGLTEVKGELRIPKASLDVQEIPVTVTTLPSDVVYVDDQNEIDDASVLLDIKAIIEDKVRLSVLGLNADLSGELQIKNSDQKQNIKAYGQLQISDGVYEIYGQKLNITQGVLFFDGPLDNPILQIRAERKAQDEQIVGIKLTGDVNNYKTTLFANPPLSDAETLSYIVTGKGLGSLKSAGDSNKIAEAVLMMGLKQNSELINGLKSGLGIDVLNVSNQSETGATVEAGKNISDKVFVGYNQGIFKHIGYWLLRYQINDKLSLETRQGEEQSVDVVYRHEKK